MRGRGSCTQSREGFKNSSPHSFGAKQRARSKVALPSSLDDGAPFCEIEIAQNDKYQEGAIVELFGDDVHPLRGYKPAVVWWLSTMRFLE
jgi:hypothetical protein